MNPALRQFLALLPDSVVVGLATLGPIAHWGKAPGTNGSVAGLLLYTVCFHLNPLAGQILLALLLLALAVIVCEEAEKRLRQRDPGIVILDEVVAVPLCFFGLQGWMAQTGHMWVYMLIGFGLFRLFDIVKPFGINRLQKQPGGMGVVLDDVAAALATCAVMHGGLWLLVTGGWLAG